MWVDILPSKEYAEAYLRQLKDRYPYDDVKYRVGQRKVNGKLEWGIYNPLIGMYEFVNMPLRGAENEENTVDR